MKTLYIHMGAPKTGSTAIQTFLEQNSKRLYQDGILTFLLPKTEENGPVFRKGEMLDGAFLATDVDLPWEEEVFTGWHFYDMAQCRRMQEAGYLTGFLIDREPWALHESTLRRDPENLYELFRKKFINRG